MNILFITSNYPTKDRRNGQTLMGHYFTREWVRSGHRVIVLHADGCFFTGKRRKVAMLQREPFEIEGVRVLEQACPRYIPRISYILPHTVYGMKRRADAFLQAEGFVPDVVAVDFCVPLWGFAKAVSKGFSCRLVPIFHDGDLHNFLSDNCVLQICRECDRIGVRSAVIGERLNKLGNKTPTFLVRSGAPDSILAHVEDIPQKQNGETFRLLFAGEHIPRKHIDVIIKALANLRDEFAFSLDILGTGECEPALQQLTNELSMEDRVCFHGRVPRDTVIEYMKKSDCFVMVSHRETFGIVYVEAMACGCYTIGSRGEGIDGVITHDVNGALVASGSVEELTAELRRYFGMTPEQRLAITSRAMEDARELTESKAAAELLCNMTR